MPDMNWIVWEHRPEKHGGDWPIAMTEDLSDAMVIACKHARCGIYQYTVKVNPAREWDIYPLATVSVSLVGGALIAHDAVTGRTYPTDWD